MRPVEKKVYNSITDKGVTYDKVLEIVDSISRQEMKKSYPDDCHFQKPSYFAKTIIKNLLSRKLIKKEGNLYLTTEKKS